MRHLRAVVYLTFLSSITAVQLRFGVDELARRVDTRASTRPASIPRHMFSFCSLHVADISPMRARVQSIAVIGAACYVATRKRFQKMLPFAYTLSQECGAILSVPVDP